MSKAGVSIGCPNCEASAVEFARPRRESGQASEFSGGERLKGTTVDCRNCGDEFELYFY